MSVVSHMENVHICNGASHRNASAHVSSPSNVRDWRSWLNHRIDHEVAHIVAHCSQTIAIFMKNQSVHVRCIVVVLFLNLTFFFGMKKIVYIFALYFIIAIIRLKHGCITAFHIITKFIIKRIFHEDL